VSVVAINPVLCMVGEMIWHLRGGLLEAERIKRTWVAVQPEGNKE